jgi:transglutaminase-like putative cysteine protease
MTRKALLCLLMLAAASALGVMADAPRMRDFVFTYSVSIGELSPGTRQVDIWLPYPTSDEHQKVDVLEISSPYPHRIIKEPEYGNSIIFISATEPMKREIDVKMTIRVRRRENVRNAFAAAKVGTQVPPPDKRWLKPDRRVPLDDNIRGIAKRVTAGRRSDIEKARAIYDFVVDTMSYDKSGTGWGNGDIYWACDTKRGNCTDFHALFIGLNRAVGIPAKFAIGFPIPPDRGEGEVGGYHCWAEFYLKDYGWIPVDASEARKHPEKRSYFFGAHDENRVQFTVGRDLVLDSRQAGEPLNFFIYPYVEVDGKPFQQIEKSFRYRDLEIGGSQPITP